MTQILQEAVVTNGYVKLKFINTIKITSILPDVFTVETNEATPQDVDDPFADFTTDDNYNSLSRTLTLYWNDGALSPSTDYTIHISGLKDAASRDIDDGIVHFTTTADTDPDSTDIEPPEPEPVEIEDFSILTGMDFSVIDTEVDEGDFAVTEIDPINGTFFLETDYNNGRISITFNQRPEIEKVNSTYFKSYRKPVQRMPIKWESVETNISIDSNDSIVYVDFPSIDDTPVYFTSGHEYFEDGFKYKVVVARGLST